MTACTAGSSAELASCGCPRVVAQASCCRADWPGIFTLQWNREWFALKFHLNHRGQCGVVDVDGLN
jgi:hypothetical protein